MANPDRYDYDPSEYFYDEETDTITSKEDPNIQYDGYGERIDICSD